MTAPGRAVPKRGLVAVLSATPEKAKAGTSWLGQPAGASCAARAGRATRRAPSRRRRRLQGGPRRWSSSCRLVPVDRARSRSGVARAAGARRRCSTGRRARSRRCSAGPVVLARRRCRRRAWRRSAKWLLVGRIAAGRAPVVELVRLAQRAGRHLRRDGRRAVVRAGRGGTRRRSTCGCARWAPDRPGGVVRDLLAARGRPGPARRRRRRVNRGCVLQTHLFHDRIMSMDTVTLAAGATLGPHGVILPAASIGGGATVGPASLVMRGDAVPAGDPLDRQPHRPVAAGRRRAVTPARGADGSRPLPARPRRRRLRRQPLRPRPRLPGRQQPARRAGRGCTSPRRRAARPAQPRPGQACGSAKVTVDGRRAARASASARGKLTISLAAAGGRRRRLSCSTSQYAGAPAPDRRHLGRGGLGGADRRRDRRRPARRRAVVVPVQRPARATRPATASPSPPSRRTTWSPTACWPSGACGRAAPRGCYEQRRADGDLPGHRADRPLRPVDRASAAPGAAARRRPAAAAARRSARLRPPAGDDGAVRASCSGRTRSRTTRSW